MGTSLREKTPNKQKSPKQKHQNKPYKQSQSRHKTQETITSNETLKTCNKFNILEKMEMEENPQPHKYKPHETENSPEHKT